MDPFAKSVQTLFPVNVILSSSDRCHLLLRDRYACCMASLLRLFPEVCDITGSIRDPASTIAYQVHRINLKLVDLETLSQPLPGPETVRRRLQQCVSEFPVDWDGKEKQEDATPWYEEWKHMFLLHQERSDHEFIGAYFGSIFVLLSDELDNYKVILTQLQARINATNVKLFFSSFMRYFVILNPASLRSYDSLSLEPSFRDFVSSYGISNCFWFDILDDDIVTSVDDGRNRNLTIVQQEMSNLRMSTSSDPLSPLEEPPVTAHAETNGHIDGRESRINEHQQQQQQHKPVVSQGLAMRCQQCLKQMVEGALMPWTEKQMRFLYDAISARKGIRKTFKLVGNFLGMAQSSAQVRGPAGYIYKLESDEMQIRRLADLAMSLGLYEMAFKFYHTAKEEFRLDGACLYFAGASEMTAVSAFLINKYQKHYFENAITTYQEPCKAYDLASRCTILATDCIRQLYPNEAALFFIRMTSEDSDLRSGLFLEQAAKCFQESILPRKRKAAFHYVLAGHRYNKCGLKRHALSCYRRFSSRTWTSAIEHVEFTVARLCLHLASTIPTKSSDLRIAGLELLRSNSQKSIFFQELLTEVTKRDHEVGGGKQTRFLLHVPFIESSKMESVEGSVIRKGRQTCFKDEKITLHFQLRSPFQLKMANLRLVTSSSSVESSRSDLELTSDQSKCLSFSLTPRLVGEFDVLGLEYECSNNFRARLHFGTKVSKSLQMNCIKTLPPIQISIQIGSSAENDDAVEMLAGEVADLAMRVNLVEEIDWEPSRLLLQSNAEIMQPNSLTSISSKGIELKFRSENKFIIRAPPHSKSNTTFFTVEYFDKTGDRRCLTKHIEIYVRECLVIEGSVCGVVSVRNTLSSGPVTLESQTEALDLWPGLTAHILLQGSLIRWKTGTRSGFLRSDSWEMLRKELL